MQTYHKNTVNLSNLCLLLCTTIKYKYSVRRKKGRERGLNGNEIDSIPLFQSHPLSSFTLSLTPIQNEMNEWVD